MGKKVAIIACALALPGEKGYTRFTFLADLLVENGYKVDLYTSTFNHWEKAQRDENKVNEIRKSTKYNIILGYEPGYKKNVDLARVVSHVKLSGNIVKELKVQNEKEKYDLIYAVIPDNFLSEKVCKFGKKHNIPVIIDVEDLWPEGMKQEFDVPVISDILYSPFSLTAWLTYKYADAFVGTSDEYRDEPLKYHADIEKKRITVYVGCDLDVFDRGVEQNVSQIEKEDDEFWFIYTGTLGTSYDIETLIRAAQEIREKGYEKIKFKILGGGPLEEQLKEIAIERSCEVEFLGYQPYEVMAAYLVKADVTVNSFVKKASQSIVNKVGDYLAASKPMINTCASKEFQQKVKNDGFGVNVEAENVDELVKAILYFYNNPDKCKECGAIARRIAESEFDRKTTYNRIVELIESLIF